MSATDTAKYGMPAAKFAVPSIGSTHQKRGALSKICTCCSGGISSPITGTGSIAASGA